MFDSVTPKIFSVLTQLQRRRAAALVGLMLVGMALETLGVGLVIPAIALLTGRDFAATYPGIQPWLKLLGNPTDSTIVVVGLLALTAVFIVKTAFLAFLAWKQSRLVFGIQAELSQRLFATYLRQPYPFFLQRNSAQLIQNVIIEVTQFASQALTPALVIMTEGFLLLGLTVLLLVVEPVGAIVVISVTGAVSWAFHRTTSTLVSRWGASRQHHEGLRIQYLQQGLGAAKDVKLLGREADFLERYREHNTESARAGGSLLTVVQLPRLGLELLSVVGLTTLVLTMMLQGRSMAQVVPALGLFGAAAYRLMPSVNRALSAAPSLRFAAPVVSRLLEELSLPASVATPSQTRTAPFRTVIELTHVSFTYPGAPGPALDDVSVSIARGESIGVIGPSGSGKSTLIDILLGLLAPSVGEVKVDGESIWSNLRAWQDHLGYVPQVIYLTDDSIRRNVAFGLADEQIDDVAVGRAIKAAQLEEFVSTLPQGIETFVGERGVRLSGGQRQRIGMARALYHDPAVLVLDEATSALDTATERDIMEAVKALQREKTVVIVAHRLSTVEHCRRLYRLEQGRVVEAGEPSALTGLESIQ